MTGAGGDPSQPGKLPEGSKQDRTGSDCPLERPVLATMSKVLLRLAEGEEPAAGMLWTGTAELRPGTQRRPRPSPNSNRQVVLEDTPPSGAR